MADSFTDDGDGDAPRPATPLLRARDATPLLDDPNDDFCRVCGFGVSCLALIRSHRSCIALLSICSLTEFHDYDHLQKRELCLTARVLRGLASSQIHLMTGIH